MESWLTNSKCSSLIKMTKVHSSSKRSTLAHMSSTSKIQEMALENRCSNLLRLEAGKHFTLVTPELSVPGVSPDVLQRSLTSQQGQCVMAAPSPPRFFAAWRVEAPFSAVSRFNGFYTVLSVTRGVALHDSASCSREDSIDEYGRSCDTLSCLLFSSQWLSISHVSRRSRSLLSHAYK